MGRTPGAKNKPKGDNVQTQTAERTESVADQPTSKGEVAIFHAARLPYHPAIEERFGLDKGAWKVLVEAIFPAAKSVDSIVMALSYCKSRGLDIMKRPVHIVPMWDSGRGAMVESVWPGISELRTTASRTKGYAGCDEAQFGEPITMTFSGRIKEKGEWKDAKIELEFPEWCRITVYRVVAGERCKFVGPKVAWLESYATQGASELPNKMWQDRPEGQLEKCAEAAALRRAFPEEIGNELTAEEMIGRNVHDLSVDIPASTGEAAAAPNKDAGPPRQIAAPAAEPQDPEQARDGTPPPREAKADAPKDDPISTGGPPRTAAGPKKAETGPSDPGPQPHRIPGAGHTYESWAEKYSDLIKTSPDMATAYKWIDLNSREFVDPPGSAPQAGPLNRLQKGKPSVYATVKKTTEQLMERLRAEQEKAAEKAKKKAEPQPEAASDDMMDGPGVTHADADVPQNPEDILAIIDQELAAVEDADQLQPTWDNACEPLVDKLDFPPDKDQAQAIFDKHSRRLGGD